VLLVVEAFVTSYGLLAVGGIASLTLGGLMLIDSPAGFLRVSPMIVVPVALATAAIAVFLLGQVLRIHRRPAVTGTEGLVQERAVAAEAFTPQNGWYGGSIRVHGELWQAVSRVPIRAGQHLIVIERTDGLTLHVRAAEGNAPALHDPDGRRTGARSQRPSS
jgi:membrane-bound serine protease (ClpP class)